MEKQYPCKATPTPEPRDTPAPSDTPKPTDTPVPTPQVTNTPLPPATPTPQVTNTPLPTPGMTPSPTPRVDRPVPKTGDRENITLFVVLMGISLSAMLMFKRRKNK